MNKVLYSIILIMLCGSVIQAGRVDDLSAIKIAALDYMDSWYRGDEKRMEQSLHQDLAKRSLREGNGGKRELRHTTAADMVLYTKSGYGESLWEKNHNIEVVVLDFYKDIATVKVIAPHYLEYLHLIKQDNNWVIVNALYEKKLPGQN